VFGALIDGQMNRRWLKTSARSSTGRDFRCVSGGCDEANTIRTRRANLITWIRQDDHRNWRCGRAERSCCPQCAAAAHSQNRYDRSGP
jgi:hypothetical protein